MGRETHIAGDLEEIGRLVVENMDLGGARGIKHESNAFNL